MDQNQLVISFWKVLEMLVIQDWELDETGEGQKLSHDVATLTWL